MFDGETLAGRHRTTPARCGRVRAVNTDDRIIIIILFAILAAVLIFDIWIRHR